MMGLFDIVILSDETKKKLGKYIGEMEFQTKYTGLDDLLRYYTVIDMDSPITIFVSVDIYCKAKMRDEPILRRVREDEICDGKPKYFDITIEAYIPTVLGSTEILERAGRLEFVKKSVDKLPEHVKRTVWIVRTDKAIIEYSDGKPKLVIEDDGEKHSLPCRGEITISSDGIECKRDDFIEKEIIETEYLFIPKDFDEEAIARVWENNIRLIFNKKIDYEFAEDGVVENYVRRVLEYIKKLIADSIVLERMR